jgi:acetyl esterase
MLARDRRVPKIAAQWLMYPTVSNKMDTASWEAFGDKNFPTRTVNTNVIAAYVPQGTSPYAPTVAPLWGDLHGLPPALVQVGEFDPLKDENLAYAEALRKAGVDATAVVYKGQMHGFVQFFKDKAHNAEGESALDAGVAFVRAELQR